MTFSIIPTFSVILPILTLTSKSQGERKIFIRLPILSRDMKIKDYKNGFQDYGDMESVNIRTLKLDL